jgi:hypothetical protein
VNATRNACKNPLEILEFVVEQSSGRIETWKEFEGEMRIGAISQKPNSEGKRRQAIWLEVFEKSERMIEFLRGRITKFCGSLDLVD